MSVLGIFTDNPLLALLPAACFFVMALVCQRAVVWGAALVWAAFAAYGYLIQKGIMSGGESRIDLLVIYPFLAVLSIVAALSALRGRKEVELP